MVDMILYDPKQAVEQVKNTKLIVSEMRRDVLVKDIDYGVVPGTTKPTLLKPGAERLCTAFGLCPEFEPISQIEDFEKGVFYYRYRCSLIHIATGKKIATGIGSCNSKEDKYRWRNEECPNCKKQKIAKSKYPDRQTGVIGWYCSACKSNFPPDQFTGAREENTDPFSIINTLDKMAQKRALIAAVLIGTNASEFFTQDVEDLPRMVDEDDVIDADFVEPERKAQPKSAPAAKSQPEQPPSEHTSGGKIERPMSPAQVYEALQRKAKGFDKPADNVKISKTQLGQYHARMKEWVSDIARKYIQVTAFGVEHSTDLTIAQFRAVTSWLPGRDGLAGIPDTLAYIEQEIAAIEIEAMEAAETQTADAEFAAI